MRRGYTLIEVLVVVTVLGIAAAMIVPSMGSAGVLRIHGAVRTLISDITFAQSDALAYQTRRAIVFDLNAETYAICEVNGSTVVPADDALYVSSGTSERYIVDLNRVEFGDANLVKADFDGSNTLVFDELGGPVKTPSGDEPLAAGLITLAGPDSTFEISIEAYTGRVSVEKVGGEGGSGSGGE